MVKKERQNNKATVSVLETVRRVSEAVVVKNATTIRKFQIVQKTICAKITQVAKEGESSVQKMHFANQNLLYDIEPVPKWNRFNGEVITICKKCILLMCASKVTT